MSQKIQPNRLQLATQELKTLNLGKFEIPSEISAGEKSGYVYICVKSKDNDTGTAKVHKAKVLYAPQGKHDEMTKDIKRFKGLWNGMFQTVVILHNPTLPLVAVRPEDEDENGMFATTGRLTDTKKETINKLMEEGKGTDDFGLNQIAKDLNAPFVKVKEYIQSF